MPVNLMTEEGVKKMWEDLRPQIADTEEYWQKRLSVIREIAKLRDSDWANDIISLIWQDEMSQMQMEFGLGAIGFDWWARLRDKLFNKGRKAARYEKLQRHYDDLYKAIFNIEDTPTKKVTEEGPIGDYSNGIHIMP